MRDFLVLTLRQIQQATQGKLIQGDPSRTIQGVSIDSRKIRRQDLFIAIRGARHDAHRFIPQVIEKGVRALVVSRKIRAPSSVSVIYVKDTTKALGHIASFHRQRFDIPVIAVTGSAGKTTTKEMIAGVLSSKYKVLKNLKTENNHIGVPLTLLRLNKSVQVAVIEFGTNQFGDIPWLAKITMPTVAVFTNIGEAHLQGLKNKNGVFREKFSLVSFMDPKGIIIYNADDKVLRRIVQKKLTQKKITFGIRYRAHLQASRLFRRNNRIGFYVKGHPFTVASMARHNVYNALAAISCGSLFKIPYNKISKNITKFKYGGGRLHVIRCGRMTVIDDTYNANPLSLESAVETLNVFETKGQRIVICADMLELGKESQRLHRQIGAFMATKNIDYVLTYGNQARFIQEGLKEHKGKRYTYHTKDRQQLHQRLKAVCGPECVVLVKGSRSMGMEQTVGFLKTEFSKS